MVKEKPNLDKNQERKSFIRSKRGLTGLLLISLVFFSIVLTLIINSSDDDIYDITLVEEFDGKLLYKVELNNLENPEEARDLYVTSLNESNYSVLSAVGDEPVEEIVTLYEDGKFFDNNQSIPVNDDFYVVVDDDIEDIEDEIAVVENDFFYGNDIDIINVVTRDDYDYYYLKVNDEELLEDGYLINNVFYNTKVDSYVDVNREVEVESAAYYAFADIDSSESLAATKEELVSDAYEAFEARGVSSTDEAEQLVNWIATYIYDDSNAINLASDNVVYSDKILVRTETGTEMTGFVQSSFVEDSTDENSIMKRERVVRSLTDPTVFNMSGNRASVESNSTNIYTVTNTSDSIPNRQVIEYKPIQAVVDTDLYFEFDAVPGVKYWYAFEQQHSATFIQNNSKTDGSAAINWVEVDESSPNVVKQPDGKFLIKLPVTDENQTLLINAGIEQFPHTGDRMPYNTDFFYKWFDTDLDAVDGGAGQTNITFTNTNSNESQTDVASLGSFSEYASNGDLEAIVYYTKTDGTKEGPITVPITSETTNYTLNVDLDDVYSIEYIIKSPYDTSDTIYRENTGIWRNYDILGECLSNCDLSDAPSSYGDIKVSIAGDQIKTYQRDHTGIGIGYDMPDRDDDFTTLSGANSLGDDNSYSTSGDSNKLAVGQDSGSFSENKTIFYDYSDDETGIGGKIQNADGELEFNAAERNWYMELPYLFDTDTANSLGVSEAKILMWIDFNQNGVFDAEEGKEVVVTPYDWKANPDGHASMYSLGYKKVNFAWDLTSYNYDESKLKADGTYLRMVMTTDMNYSLSDASKSPEDTETSRSFGEVEDYKLKAVDNRNECGATLVNNVEMIPREVETQGSSVIKYVDIKNPYGENIDVVVTVGNGGLFTTEQEEGSSLAFGYIGPQAVFNYIKSQGYFSVDIYKTGTNEHMDVPIQFKVSDLDQFEKFASYPPPSYILNENDGFWTEWASGQGVFGGNKPSSYPTFTGHLTYDYSRVGGSVNNGGGTFISARYDQASAGSATLGWISRSKMYFGVDDGHDNGEAVDVIMTFPTNRLVEPCNDKDPEVVKTSTPSDGTWVEPGEKIHYEVELKADALGLWKQAPIKIEDIIPENATYVDGSGIVNYRTWEYDHHPYDPDNPNEVVSHETRNVGYITTETDADGNVTKVIGNYDGILKNGDTVVLEFDVIVDEIPDTTPSGTKDWSGNLLSDDKYTIITNMEGTIGNNNELSVNTNGAKVIAQSTFDVDYSRPFTFELDLDTKSGSEYQIGIGFAEEMLSFGDKYGELPNNEAVYIYNSHRSGNNSAIVSQYVDDSTNQATTSVVTPPGYFGQDSWEKMHLAYDPFAKEMLITLTSGTQEIQIVRKFEGNPEDYSYIGLSLETWNNPDVAKINTANFLYTDVDVSKVLVNKAKACYTDYSKGDDEGEENGEDGEDGDDDDDKEAKEVCLDSNETLHPTGDKLEDMISASKSFEELKYDENGQEITPDPDGFLDKDLEDGHERIKYVFNIKNDSETHTATVRVTDDFLSQKLDSYYDIVGTDSVYNRLKDADGDYLCVNSDDTIRKCTGSDTSSSWHTLEYRTPNQNPNINDLMAGDITFELQPEYEVEMWVILKVNNEKAKDILTNYYPQELGADGTLDEYVSNKLKVEDINTGQVIEPEVIIPIKPTVDDKPAIEKSVVGYDGIGNEVSSGDVIDVINSQENKLTYTIEYHNNTGELLAAVNEIRDPLLPGIDYIDGSQKFYLVANDGSETEITNDSSVSYKYVSTADPSKECDEDAISNVNTNPTNGKVGGCTYIARYNNSLKDGETLKLVFDAKIVDVDVLESVVSGNNLKTYTLPESGNMAGWGEEHYDEEFSLRDDLSYNHNKYTDGYGIWKDKSKDRFLVESNFSVDMTKNWELTQQYGRTNGNGASGHTINFLGLGLSTEPISTSMSSLTHTRFDWNNMSNNGQLEAYGGDANSMWFGSGEIAGGKYNCGSMGSFTRGQTRFMSYYNGEWVRETDPYTTSSSCDLNTYIGENPLYKYTYDADARELKLTITSQYIEDRHGSGAEFVIVTSVPENIASNKSVYLGTTVRAPHGEPDMAHAVSLNSLEFEYLNNSTEQETVFDLPNTAYGCYAINTLYEQSLTNDYDLCNESNTVNNMFTSEIIELETEKTAVDAGGNGYIENGEDVTYTITITNDNNVNLGEYIVTDNLTDIDNYFVNYNNASVNVEIEKISDGSLISVGYSPNPLNYGQLSTSGLTIDNLPAESIVTLTYTLTAKDDIEENHAGEKVYNKAVVDPTDPTDPNPPDPEVEVPVKPIIVLDKAADDASGNGLVNNDELVSYTVTLTNASEVDLGAYTFVDTLTDIGNYYLNYNDAVVTVAAEKLSDSTPVSIGYSPNPANYGQLSTSGLTIDSLPADTVVTLTYAFTSTSDVELLHAGEIVRNVVTATPTDPDDPTPDEAEEVLPIEDEEDDPTPPTSKDVQVFDESGNEKDYIYNGDDVIYTVKLANETSTTYGQYTFVDTLTDIDNYFIGYDSATVTVSGESLIDGSAVALTYTPNPVTYGDLSGSGLLFDSIPGDTEITLTYTLKAKDDIQENYAGVDVYNIVVIDPVDPDDPDPTDPDAEIPIAPVIETEKLVSDASGNGYVSSNENITYTVTATNASNIDLGEYIFTDTLTDIADYFVDYNDAIVTVRGEKVSDSSTVTLDYVPSALTYGELSTTGMKLLEFPADTKVILEYTLTAKSGIETTQPDELIDNIAVIDPTDPTDPNPPDPEVTIPVEPNVITSKEVEDTDGNNSVNDDENITYTVKVTNTSSVDLGAYNVVDILTDIDNYYVGYDSAVVTVSAMTVSSSTPTTITTTPSVVTYGDLRDADGDGTGLLINNLPADTEVTIVYTLVAKDNVEADYAGDMVHNLAVVKPVDPNDPDPTDPEAELPVDSRTPRGNADIIKDVNLEEEWTVEDYKESFTFHISYILSAANASDYDTIILEDDVDKNLEILSVKVLDVKQDIDITSYGQLDIVDNDITFTIDDTTLITVYEPHIQLVIEARFDNSLSDEELSKLGEAGVPNVGQLKLYSGIDEFVFDSNEVNVYGPIIDNPDPVVPKTGSINYMLWIMVALVTLLTSRVIYMRYKKIK